MKHICKICHQQTLTVTNQYVACRNPECDLREITVGRPEYARMTHDTARQIDATLCALGLRNPKIERDSGLGAHLSEQNPMKPRTMGLNRDAKCLESEKLDYV